MSGKLSLHLGSLQVSHSVIVQPLFAPGAAFHQIKEVLFVLPLFCGTPNFFCNFEYRLISPCSSCIKVVEKMKNSYMELIINFDEQDNTKRDWFCSAH